MGETKKVGIIYELPFPALGSFEGIEIIKKNWLNDVKDIAEAFKECEHIICIAEELKWYMEPLIDSLCNILKYETRIYFWVQSREGIEDILENISNEKKEGLL